MPIIVAMDEHFKPEQWFEKRLRAKFGPRHGWITRACNQLGVSRQAFDYWRSKGIPEDRARQVKAVCKV